MQLVQILHCRIPSLLLILHLQIEGIEVFYLFVTSFAELLNEFAQAIFITATCTAGRFVRFVSLTSWLLWRRRYCLERS